MHWGTGIMAEAFSRLTGEIASALLERGVAAGAGVALDMRRNLTARGAGRSGHRALFLAFLLLSTAPASAQGARVSALGVRPGQGNGSVAPAGTALEPRLAAPVPLLTEELLTNPTLSGITISLIPAVDAELFVEYGRRKQGLTTKTRVASVAAGERALVRLENLAPSTRYVYRVWLKRSWGEFEARPMHSFTTLRLEDETFRFAFATDGHSYELWSKSNCGTRPNPGLLALHRTLENVKDAGVDWFLTTGDEVHTHCLSCTFCTVNGESAGWGTVQSLREAELRYETLMGPEIFGRITADLPFFYVLGNHDGEMGFGDARGSCGHYDTTNVFSEVARQGTIPSPASAYPGGNPEGTYYAFESGDALFVALDIFKYTEQYPQGPEDWTLGETQLAWLADTLAASDKRWKFVLAHHLVGGTTLGGCYHYGRGGLRSTNDGTPRGLFNGEQAKIHAMLQAFDATAFLYGHDHIAIAGEKQGFLGAGDGVHYIQGGQLGHRVPGWATDPHFAEQMDWDEDGLADYYALPPKSGTFERGFFLVTVEGKERVRFDYIATDAYDVASNGRTVFSYVIE